MMYALHTHLRVPYDTCVKHISKNMRKTLQVRIVRQDTSDVVDILPLESIRNMAITHMQEGTCSNRECLHGTMLFNENFYRFNTHQKSYDVVIMMEKASYPFNKMKLVLPITSYPVNNENYMIYIPSEYTSDEKVVPIEFVWEFLSQLHTYFGNNVDN